MKRISILLVPLLLLSSCASNEDKIRLIDNYDIIFDSSNEPYIEIKAQNIIKKIENKESFCLYIYSSGCSFCQVSSENIKNISKNIPYTIYRYTLSLSSYKLLSEYNSSIFPEDFSTPRMMMFKDGNFNIEINSNRLIKENLLKNSLSSFTYKTNIYTLTNLDSYQDFLNNNDSFLLFYYSSNNNLNYEIKNEISLLLDISNKTILYLDAIDLNEELNDFINENINKTSYEYFFTAYSNNNYKDYLEVNNDNKELIIESINSYYND